MSARVVVEVQKRARLQVEDSWAHLAQHTASTEFIEKRRYPGENGRTSVLHFVPPNRSSTAPPVVAEGIV